MADYISTTSRYLDPTNRSWVSVVYQSGKSILDSELNLAQSIANQPSMKSIPSGFISNYPISTDEGGFVFYDTLDGQFQANHLVIKPFYVNLNGHEVYISGTNDPGLSTGYNFIDLGSPPSPTGNAPDIKRTDFVFLEFWFALVTPTTNAEGWFRVNSNADLSSGDTVSIDGTNFGGNLVTLVADTDFSIGATESETARNIRDAINNLAPGSVGISMIASTKGTEFVFLKFDGGANGNQIVLTSVVSNDPSAITLKNPTGGSLGQGVPAPNSIYYAGNTQAPLSTFLPDDIIDSNLNEETTRRVQIQYRFRVYSENYNFGNSVGSGVNPKVEPDGFSNANIFAQGGTSSAQNGYTFSRASDGTFPIHDTGLYYAGSGSEAHATALNTVDGYVYALPVCFVFRRNEGFFSPETQANNGLLHDHDLTTNSNLDQNGAITIPANKSDRPDGLFADVIVETDILDLRKRVFPSGVDYSAELDRQFSLLLDNQINTWFMDSSDFRLSFANGSGEQTTSPLVCDEVGRSSISLGGPNTNNRGSFIRNFDKVTNRFSDVPVLSRLVLEVYPDGTNDHQTAISVAGVGNKWYEDKSITVDISKLEANSNFRFWTDTGDGVDLHLDDAFPTGTKIIDVLECWHDEGNFNTVVPQEAFFSTITGLGTNTITLKLDRNLTEVTGGVDLGLTDQNDPASFLTYKMVGNPTVGDVGSPRRLFITLLVEYPAKEGLNATPVSTPNPDSEVYPTGSVIEYNSSQRAGDSVAQPPLVFFREGVREVSIERVVNSITESFITTTGTTLKLPWKIHVDDTGVYDPTLQDAITGNVVLNLPSSKLGSTDSELSWSAPFLGQRLVSLTAHPRAPVSNSGTNGYQVGVYYRARASQTFGAKNAPLNLPNEVTVKPIKVSEKLWSIQSGSSTSEESYPYASPSVQIGVHPDVGDYNSEADLMGSTRMMIEDISINSGVMALSSVLPMDTSGDITFTTPEIDKENRVVFKSVSSGYKPNSFSQSLDESVLHKNALPFLARVESSSEGDNEVHFRNGEIVLVVISKISELPHKSGKDSRKNNVLFSTENRTVACIYKTKDLILSGV